ncbi:MAG: glycosyl transferase, partial [Gammaproteobacteria bacterium]
GVTDQRKGFQFIREGILQGLWSQLNNGKKTRLIIFGSDTALDFSDSSLAITSLGIIDNDRQIRLAYCAADVVIMPSIAETFGKVAAEAMACGVPVVSFDTGGLRDIVEHGKTGYRATCFDLHQLFGYVARILHDHDLKEALGAAARVSVQHFSKRLQAVRYRQLYEEVLTASSL